MYQIAICDDEREVGEYLRKTLIKKFEENFVSVEVELFDDGQQFLKMFASHYHYDVVFLDIDMPGQNGIEVCRSIRGTSPECICVFISNKAELVFQSFEVQPFRFIRKTEFPHQCGTLVKALKKELERRQRHLIQFVEPGTRDIFSFEVSSILYIEAQRKKTKIVTEHDETLVEMKFMCMEEQLQEYCFLKPHRSFLVNCQHVFRIRKDAVILKNGASVPISRNRIEEVRVRFIHYVDEGML